MTIKSASSQPPIPRSLVGYLTTSGQTYAILSEKPRAWDLFHHATPNHARHFLVTTHGDGKLWLTPLESTLLNSSWLELGKFFLKLLTLRFKARWITTTRSISARSLPGFTRSSTLLSAMKARISARSTDCSS